MTGQSAPRTARRERETKETRVVVEINLDGSGEATASTGVGFYDHLLSSFAHHALFDLTVTCAGDLDVDDHHTVEDTALTLGAAVGAALGEREGIVRFGDAWVPMDEALAQAVVDVGGRPYCVTDLEFSAPRIGSLTAHNIPHALEAFAGAAGITLHLRARGRNDHHIAEAAFKALARAMRSAVAHDPRRRGLPSTKGAL